MITITKTIEIPEPGENAHTSLRIGYVPKADPKSLEITDVLQVGLSVPGAAEVVWTGDEIPEQVRLSVSEIYEALCPLATKTLSGK